MGFDAADINDDDDDEFTVEVETSGEEEASVRTGGVVFGIPEPESLPPSFCKRLTSRGLDIVTGGCFAGYGGGKELKGVSRLLWMACWKKIKRLV